MLRIIKSRSDPDSYYIADSIGSEVIGLSTTSNGEPVKEQIPTGSVNQQWLFEKADLACLIGSEATDEDMSSWVKECEPYARQASIDMWSTTTITAANALNWLKQSTLFITGTHATSSGIKLTPDKNQPNTVSNLYASTISSLSGNPLYRVKVVVYMGCETAKGSSNICTATRDKGAKAVIGFKKIIDDPQCTDWTREFLKKMAAGSTVQDAKNAADIFVENNYPNNTKNVPDNEIYGNKSQTLK